MVPEPPCPDRGGFLAEMGIMGRHHGLSAGAAEALLPGQAVHSATPWAKVATGEPFTGRMPPEKQLTGGVKGQIAWRKRHMLPSANMQFRRTGIVPAATISPTTKKYPPAANGKHLRVPHGTPRSLRAVRQCFFMPAGRTPCTAPLLHGPAQCQAKKPCGPLDPLVIRIIIKQGGQYVAAQQSQPTDNQATPDHP